MGASGPYRDGKVHVLSVKCATCIFRPGNPMRLAEGRVKGMVDEAMADQTAITCHSTLYRDDVDEAVCRGFFDAHADRSIPLLLAKGMGIVREVDPPTKDASTP